MGINVSSIDPRNIRIYGNGGGMLPERIADFRYDDLAENAIQVIGENDGVFNQGDYILFYGQSPNTWTYDPASGRFLHKVNIYSNNTFTDCQVGINGKRSNNNIISGNHISDSVIGLSFAEYSDSIITKNIILNNNQGILYEVLSNKHRYIRKHIDEADNEIAKIKNEFGGMGGGHKLARGIRLSKPSYLRLMDTVDEFI